MVEAPSNGDPLPAERCLLSSCCSSLAPAPRRLPPNSPMVRRWRSMGDDLSRFALSAVVLAVLFLMEYLAVSNAPFGELRGQLNKARGRLARLDSKFPGTRLSVPCRDAEAIRCLAAVGKRAGCGHRDAEGPVLSRNRSNSGKRGRKTVRQQASSVYRKAGVTGRNELAAWFFEDMLEPPPVGDHRNEEANNPKGS